MNPITAAQRRITTAFQATTWWATQTAPGDFASGTASTSWTPVVTVLTAALGDVGTLSGRVAMYAQVANLIRQNLDAVRNNSYSILSASARRDSLAYGGLLLAAYERLTIPGEITV